LGNVISAQGDYPSAVGYYEASFALREEFNDAEGMAVALIHLGAVALQMESFTNAQRSFERAVAIYEEIYDKGGLAAALNFLGRTEITQADFQKTLDQFRRALKIAAEIQFTPLILSLLVGIGQLLLELERIELGLEVLSLVASHRATEYDIRLRAEQILEEAHESLDDEIRKAIARVQQGNLDELLDIVRASLVTMKLPAVGGVSDSKRAMLKANQTLIEPLTPRELEVLEFIAKGLINRQIADQLIISIGTVKSYTSQIYGKLGVGNRTQAVAYARTLGLIG